MFKNFTASLSAMRFALVISLLTISCSLLAAPPYTLDVTAVGNGTVSVDPDVATYLEGESVELTATPDALHQFDGWSVDLISNSNPVSINMDANKSITATFSIRKDLPPDADEDGEPNATDDDDDNDLLLDSEDPFALDANNGLTTNLPVSLPLFSNDPDTGLYGLGFTGLMSNGVIGGQQGDNYQDLYDLARVVLDDSPVNGGVLTLEDVDDGDAYRGINTQTHAFQLGLNLDLNSASFVVHSRILAPWFNGIAVPEDFMSEGMFIGAGNQNSYLKVVFDGSAGNTQVLLDIGGEPDSQNSGPSLMGSNAVDLYLVVNPSAGVAQAQVSLDGGSLINVGNPVVLPGSWLDDQDDFGLAMGLISTSYGPGPVFDAHFDLLEAYYLAIDDAFAALEDDTTMALDVLANDHAEVFIVSVGAPVSGGSAVFNDNATPADFSDDFIDYTPGEDFAGIDTFSYTVEVGNGVTGTAVVTVDVAPINDAPVVSFSGNLLILKDAGAQTQAAFAAFSSGGGADEAGQANLGFTVSNDSNGLFSVQPGIANDGTLTFTPADNATGVAKVSVSARDDGGTDNGGNDTSAAQMFTITISEESGIPSVVAPSDQVIAEDAATGSLAFPVSDADTDLDTLLITAESSNITLVPDANIILAGSGASRTVTVTPVADANGSAVITLNVDDGTNVTSASFDLTVNAVNDAPSMDVGGDQSVYQDVGTQTVVGFASNFQPGGGPDEVDQVVDDYLVSNDNYRLFLTQPDIANDGSLSYTPAAGEYGVAVVTVNVRDSGDVLFGGTNTSTEQTFSITVKRIVVFSDSFEER